MASSLRIVLTTMLLAAGAPVAFAQSPQHPDDLASFKDCDVCPEMIALPSGSFMMGASKADDKVPFATTASEKPRRQVTFDYRFALSKYTVTVAEYAAFVDETGFVAGGECFLRLPDKGPNHGKFEGTISANAGEYERGGGAVLVEYANFRKPGVPVVENQPATCISMNEAEAYLDWLSSKSGRQYRLPTESEFEYATRAGEKKPYFFGGKQQDLCDYANFGDRDSPYGTAIVAPCAETDSREYTYPVGSFKANNWGLHDMVGNVFQFLEDCTAADYSNAPSDGSPYKVSGDECPSYATRGFLFDSIAVNLRSAARCEALSSKDHRSNALGLRVAVSLDGNAWDLRQ